MDTITLETFGNESLGIIALPGRWSHIESVMHEGRRLSSAQIRDYYRNDDGAITAICLKWRLCGKFTIIGTRLPEYEPSRMPKPGEMWQRRGGGLILMICDVGPERVAIQQVTAGKPVGMVSCMPLGHLRLQFAPVTNEVVA